jgi:predicted RNA binding protein YcfA (HicA-like mRNA interferase family)
MRLPRDLKGKDLAKKLEQYGYSITRQTGSHMRLTTCLNGKHHVTIPVHDPIKIGTFNNILKDVSKHLNINKKELMNKLL